MEFYYFNIFSACDKKMMKRGRELKIIKWVNGLSSIWKQLGSLSFSLIMRETGCWRSCISLSLSNRGVLFITLMTFVTRRHFEFNQNHFLKCILTIVLISLHDFIIFYCLFHHISHFELHFIDIFPLKTTEMQFFAL